MTKVPLMSGSSGYATETLDTSYNFVVLNNLDPEMATFNEENFNESVRYDGTALSSDSMTNTLSTQHYANRDQSPFPNENGVYAIEHQLTVDTTGDVVIEVTGIDTGANIPFVAFHNNQIYYSKEAHGSDGSHLPSSLEILNAQAGDEIDLVVASNPHNTYAYPFNVSGYIVDATNSQTFAVQQPALNNVPTVAGDYFNFGMGSENSFWIDAGMDFSEVDIEITLSNGQAFNNDNNLNR